MYQSSDGGKNWSALHVPSDFADVAVQRPTTAGSWHVCISAPNPAGPLGNATCSQDGGQSWTSYQWPAGSDSGDDFHVGLANDGSLLVRGSAGTDAGGSPEYTLYRLTQGGTKWQSVGPVPELQIGYSDGPSAGILWALPAVGVGIDPQQRPFTADYPS